MNQHQQQYGQYCRCALNRHQNNCHIDQYSPSPRFLFHVKPQQVVQHTFPKHKSNNTQLQHLTDNYKPQNKTHLPQCYGQELTTAGYIWRKSNSQSDRSHCSARPNKITWNTMSYLADYRSSRPAHSSYLNGWRVHLKWMQTSTHCGDNGHMAAANYEPFSCTMLIKIPHPTHSLHNQISYPTVIVNNHLPLHTYSKICKMTCIVSGGRKLYSPTHSL